MGLNLDVRSPLLRAAEELLLVALLLSLTIERVSKSLYGLRLFFDHGVLSTFHRIAAPWEPFFTDALLVASGMVGVLLLAQGRSLRHGKSLLVGLALAVALAWSFAERLSPEVAVVAGRLVCLLALIAALLLLFWNRGPGTLALLGSCILSLWFVGLRWLPPEQASLALLSEAGQYVLLLGVSLAAFGGTSFRAASPQRLGLLVSLVVAVPLIAWLAPAVWTHGALHIFGLVSGGPTTLPKAVLLAIALAGILLAPRRNRAPGLRLALALLLTSSHHSGPHHEAACVAAALLLLAQRTRRGEPRQDSLE